MLPKLKFGYPQKVFWFSVNVYINYGFLGRVSGTVSQLVKVCTNVETFPVYCWKYFWLPSVITLKVLFNFHEASMIRNVLLKLQLFCEIKIFYIRNSLFHGKPLIILTFDQFETLRFSPKMYLLERGWRPGFLWLWILS